MHGGPEVLPELVQPNEDVVTASSELYEATPTMSRQVNMRAVVDQPRTPLNSCVRIQDLSVIQGSSTQGTASPQPTDSLSRNLEDIAAKTSVADSPSSYLENLVNSPHKKRTADAELSASPKRHKVGEVTPWLIRRV